MDNVRYNNYHKHTYYSNICTLDVVTSPEDYMKKAVELGHTTYFSTEHGYIGNIYEAKTLCEKYNLKLIAGIEAYYVPNRFEKDKSNYHLILIALNTDGYKDLNYLMSKSNVDGFYYKPRIDDELLFSVNPENIIVTSACIAGRMRNEDGRDEWIQKMKNYFGNNFYLEVQAHNCDSQAKYNKMILEYSKKYNIKIIHANDSHYISPEDSKYRDLFLKAKGLIYEEENDFILDYPTSEVIFDRYHKQGILNDEQIKEALNNTLIFDKCEELDINKEIKMPKIYDNPIEKLEEIIKKEWESEKINIDKSRVSEYENSIKSEFYTIKNTNMADYFLLNYELIKLATTKYGGVITKTGRGSAPSFYINKLLHFTDIDRIGSCITLFPSRFMSAARILGTKSLPDIDFNCSNQKPFYEASKKLLGDDGCYWMLAYKPLQTSSAFRLYCKSQDMNINEYNDVAINLAELAQEKKSYIESKYYKDDKWKILIDESQHFVGVVESVSKHPCSTLLMDKPISREVGLIKAGDIICANISSYESDNYKYLKNDLLEVTVWDIINKTCELAGIEVPTIRKLEQILDEKTYEVYEKGLTTTINQADSNYATNLVRQYKPKSISDMSAFVAIIRPGCASLLDDFIDRKDYTTNIKELDDLLDDSGHRMIYQESIMKYLIWLGIEESETYTIIKKIAKKKFKEDELNKLKEKLLENWIEKTGFSKGFEETWQVVEDAAHYSFNACIAGDTVIQKAGANGKNITVEEMYNIANNIVYAKETNHLPLYRKYKSQGYGNALSMYDDKKVRKNKIVNIYDSGIADIYRVKTECGAYVDCTMNHKFPTPNGKMRLDNLKIGDELYVKDIYEKHPDNYRFTNGNFEKNTPKKGQKGFQKNPNGNSVLFNNRYNYYVKNKISCEKCGKPYDESKFELHHVDMDRTNNNSENLKWLCNSCHKKIHYKLGRMKSFEKGIPVTTSKIVSIKYIKTNKVYDIEMEAPAHNFISESGLITSNSHSLSYAYDSLYGAYLKSHYPLEYYTVVLNSYKDDQDRTSKLIEELKYFKIKLKPIKYGKSRSQYSLDKSTNSIYKGIGSIKYLNDSCAEELYNIAQTHYDNFMQLLFATNSIGINSRQLDILIKLDFFSDFGNVNELLEMVTIFNKLKNGTAKTLAKGKLENPQVERIVANYSNDRGKNGNILKSYTILNMSKILDEINDFIKALKIPDMTLQEKIQIQQEYLGYISNTGKEEDRKSLLVKDIFPLNRKKDNVQFGYSIITQSLGSGVQARFTIFNETYNSCGKIKKGSLIRCEEYYSKNNYFTLKKYKIL